jgi:hypothetical protein
VRNWEPVPLLEEKVGILGDEFVAGYCSHDPSFFPLNINFLYVIAGSLG